MDEVASHIMKIKITELGQLSPDQFPLVCRRLDISPVTIRVGMMNEMLDRFVARVAGPEKQRMIGGLSQEVNRWF